MTKKIILKSLLLTILGFVLVLPSAFAATAIVDNDALSSAPGTNDMSGSWTWHSGSGYNNDYRTIPSNASSTAHYVWIYDVMSVNASYYVYLANPAFTNPKVSYQIGEYGGWVNINQNAAPTAWNFLKQYSGTHHFINLPLVQASSIGTIGADATRLVY